MFICPEIEKYGDPAIETIFRQVFERRADTNATQIQGIEADGDSGLWDRLQRKYKRDDNGRFTPVELSYFAKDPDILNGVTLPSEEKTITEYATHTGVSINTSFTDTNDFYWNVKNLLAMRSSFWFTVVTPDGLSFYKPEADGDDRGTVLETDMVSRGIFDKTIDYDGETGADVYVTCNTQIVPATINSTYKTMAVNKEVAKRNYIIFQRREIFNLGDYVRSWDGVKYVVLSGRKISNDEFDALYEYTAVKEVTDSLSFTGNDVSAADVFDAVNTVQVGGKAAGGVWSDDHDDWIYIGGGGDAPSFLNGWANQSVNDTSLRFKKLSDNTVKLEGVVSARSATSTTVCVLPAGYRPNKTVLFPAIQHAFSGAGLATDSRVSTNGNIEIYGYSTSTSYYWIGLFIIFSLD